MNLKTDRQYRSMQPMQIRADEGKKIESDYYVEGYAATWEPYQLAEDAGGEPIFEMFEKTAFKDTDMSDIIFLYDHKGKVMARKSNGTLKVELDDKGIFVAADLSKSQAAKDMYEEINNGLVTKMSWAFSLGDYEFDKKTRTIIHRTIKKIYDVSAVGIPANNATEIASRSFVDGVIDKVQAERLEREKLQLQIQIELERG